MKIIKASSLQDILKDKSIGDATLIKTVKDIVEDVKANKDDALFKYSLKFDGTDFTKTAITVSQAEFENAYKQVNSHLIEAIKLSIQNVLKYHTRNKKSDFIKEQDGKTTGYIVRAVESCAVYVPGGTAAYPSSVIMGVIPAKAAGVENICAITPAKNGKINPATLVALKECGVETVYKIGGAQAVAALAFGTQSVKKTDLIVGPGNIYVALAKKEVYGYVGIDMIAGPSEILVIADKYANAKFVAADMLSQAEHDSLSASYAVTDSLELAQNIKKEIELQLNKLDRFDIAKKAIDNNSAIIVCENLQEAAQISNKIAPEHLELMVKNPDELLPLIKNAGAVFLGSYTPEPIGDYFAGPSHVLPTSGSARFFQVLNEDTFLKKISVVNYTKDALKNDARHILCLAESEGLSAHANAVKIRLEEDICE